MRSIWHCDDCHRIGFYYGLTAEEMRAKHAKECDARMDDTADPPLPEVK